jgi:hypothetical protein
VVLRKMYFIFMGLFCFHLILWNGNSSRPEDWSPSAHVSGRRLVRKFGKLEGVLPISRGSVGPRVLLKI